MNKRILFCVETTKQADTDYAYIKDTIDYYFVQSSKITIRPVYMESKSRYKSKAVQEDIKRQSGLADTSVIYCIDTDDYDISPEDRTLLEQIRQYCKKKGYEFIFFCKDVEDVYCGKRIPDTQKIKAIKQFRSTHAIAKTNPKLLEKEQYQPHCSNILNVLNKFWAMKDTGNTIDRNRE